MRKDEIKKIKICVTLACFLNFALICFFSYLHYKKYHYVDKGQLVAKINGLKVYEKDIQSRIDFLEEEIGQNNLKLEDLEPDVLKAMLMEIYTNNLILKLAEKKDFIRDNNYRFLAKEYYNRLIKEVYINKFVINSVVESDIKQEYDRLVKKIENKEERKISHILVATEEEINRVRNTVLRRNNFEKIAEQKSLDKPSAINGGSIGYVIKEEIAIPEFANVAFMLKKGELSRPIQTKEGWHIIKVDDIRKIKMKTFEESRQDILEKLQHKKFEEFINKLLEKHGGEINIEIIKNGKTEKFDVNFNEKSTVDTIQEINKENIIDDIINETLNQ